MEFKVRYKFVFECIITSIAMKFIVCINYLYLL